MKKTLNNLVKFLVLLVLVTGCQDDDKTFGNLDAPTNLEFNYDIVGKTTEAPNGDGTGNVKLRATADNAISFKYIFPDGSETTVAGGEYTKRFTKTGVNSYEVTVIAYGKGGVATSGTFMVEDVLSNFEDPETAEFLTGTGTKVWYWAAATPGHLGVGPNNTDPTQNAAPIWYSAAPFEKAGSPDSSCLYDNKLTFKMDNGIIKYTLDNGGNTFTNADFTDDLGVPSGADLCIPYDTSGERVVVLEPANSVVDPAVSTGTQFTITNNGFLGYYIGQSTYEILSISENQMVVRAVMGGNPAIAWYHILTTQPPYADNEPVYDNLVWSDEFDTDGAPDASKWNMETGTGDGGWGNNEAQFYKAENATVTGGKLIITAKKETFQGSQYTSARMNSHSHFDFTYGKVEWSAKLPTGQGTWPALWMLGSNYLTNQWPACGEIDVMEHVGTGPDIHGTLHMPGNSGGNAISGTTAVPTYNTEFHKYSVTWSPNWIKFYVDDSATPYTQWANTPGSPFNANFFLIMNVAIGGNFGGDIDPNFTQSTMEVEYVRVYQGQ
jgi:hypothetical protein